MHIIFTDKVEYISTDKNVPIPTRATTGSAGIDFYLPEDITIPAKGFVTIDTKIIAKTPKGFVTNLYPRSSIGVKKHIMLANTVGVIDSDYNETIKATLFNYGDETVQLKKNDRFMQSVTTPYIVALGTPTTNTRNGGIGSTGR